MRHSMITENDNVTITCKLSTLRRIYEALLKGYGHAFDKVWYLRDSEPVPFTLDGHEVSEEELYVSHRDIIDYYVNEALEISECGKLAAKLYFNAVHNFDAAGSIAQGF